MERSVACCDSEIATSHSASAGITPYCGQVASPAVEEEDSTAVVAPQTSRLADSPSGGRVGMVIGITPGIERQRLRCRGSSSEMLAFPLSTS